MAFLDSSVLLASLDPEEAHHRFCDRLVSAGGNHIYSHALAETFSVLTGGRQGRRFSTQSVVALLEEGVLPYVSLQTLTGKDMVDAIKAAHHRGVRGGAIYDWLHLTAARKAGAEVFYTLNLRDFQALARPGDPTIQAPTAP
jgi:predicted nucleic acid-binding protein